MFNFYFNFYNSFAGILNFRLNIMEINFESGLICLALLPIYDITVHSK